MRNYLLSSVLALSFLLSAIGSKAMPCHLFCRDSACATKARRPVYGFYSLDYGLSWTNSSPQLNNWLLHEGYVPTGGTQSFYGLSETFFLHKWMYEFSIHKLGNFGYGNATSMENDLVGIGYNFLNTKFFSAYGALGIGVNSFYLRPNQSTLGDLGLYNQPSSAYFEQDAWLINPHILLYRNITNNLAVRPGRISAIGLGLDLGFNLAFSQSGWQYGYSNDRPFSATTVYGIPNSAFSGFYVMGRIGWYFGRE